MRQRKSFGGSVLIWGLFRFWNSRWAWWVRLSLRFSFCLLIVSMPNSVSAGTVVEVIKRFPEHMEQTHALLMSHIPLEVIPVKGIHADIKPTRFPLVSLYFIGSCAEGSGFTRDGFRFRKNADLGTILPSGRGRFVAVGNPYLRALYKVNAGSRASILQFDGSLKIILVVRFILQQNVLRKYGALDAKPHSYPIVLTPHLLQLFLHSRELTIHRPPLFSSVVNVQDSKNHNHDCCESRPNARIGPFRSDPRTSRRLNPLIPYVDEFFGCICMFIGAVSLGISFSCIRDNQGRLGLVIFAFGVLSIVAAVRFIDHGLDLLDAVPNVNTVNQSQAVASSVAGYLGQFG
jgi:hypothetical protein